MGNLIREPMSEVVATIERLDHFGITLEDFKEVRSDDVTARAVVEAWHEVMKNRFANEEVASTFTPVNSPSRLMSVYSAWQTPICANCCPNVTGVHSLTCCQPCVATWFPRASSATAIASAPKRSTASPANSG